LGEHIFVAKEPGIDGSMGTKIMGFQSSHLYQGKLILLRLLALNPFYGLPTGTSFLSLKTDTAQCEAKGGPT